MELAQGNCFSQVNVEGDAKICLDAITARDTEIPWKILSIISCVKQPALNFSLCSIGWVRRDANSEAHTLAKFAYALPFNLSCNGTNLPPFVREA